MSNDIVITVGCMSGSAMLAFPWSQWFGGDPKELNAGDEVQCTLVAIPADVPSDPESLAAWLKANGQAAWESAAVGNADTRGAGQVEGEVFIRNDGPVAIRIREYFEVDWLNPDQNDYMDHNIQPEQTIACSVVHANKVTLQVDKPVITG